MHIGGPAAIKSFAEKLGISVAKVEKYWEEAKEIVDKEYSKAKESEKYYGTAMKILKNKLKKHEGLTESRFANFLYEEDGEGIEDSLGEIDFVEEFVNAGRAYEMGYTVDSVDEDELEMGIKIEMEHTTNREIAKRIALDHLTELPDYYTRLAKMEEEGKEELNINESEAELMNDLEWFRDGMYAVDRLVRGDINSKYKSRFKKLSKDMHSLWDDLIKDRDY